MTPRIVSGPPVVRRAIVAGVTFPLETLATAIGARDETWGRLGLVWHTRPVDPNHGKPVVVSAFESAMWLGDIMIWSTGEAELEAVRLADERMVLKHYDLSTAEDLEVLVDELIGLLAADRVPAAAVVVRDQERPTEGPVDELGSP